MSRGCSRTRTSSTPAGGRTHFGRPAGRGARRLLRLWSAMIATRDSVLVVERLGGRFGGLRALQEGSLEIRAGGGGEEWGGVVWEGQRSDGWLPHRLSRAGIGRTFQNISKMSGIGARDLI